MKKLLSIICALLVFIFTLEFCSRAYFFKNSENWTGSLEYRPLEILANWRGLPYEIPLRDGELVRYTKGGAIVYNVPFRINENSTRVSTQAVDEKVRDIIFIGCSFTFGAGVKDHETLPSYVGMNFKGTRAHNFGMVGATSIESLLRLRKLSPQDFRQKEKLVIYIFIGDHLRRHALVLPYVGGWGKDKLVFHRKEDKYEALGKYRDIYSLRSPVYTFLSQSGIGWFLYPLFDLQFSEDEKNEYLISVELMKKQGQRIGGNFLVLIWPGTQTPGWFLQGMKEKGISYLNLSQVNLRKLTKTPYIPVDSHPTAESYKIVGDLLINHLNKKETR